MTTRRQSPGSESGIGDALPVWPYGAAKGPGAPEALTASKPCDGINRAHAGVARATWPQHGWRSATVAKLGHAPYGTEPSTWLKIKNPAYSQANGRRARFEEMRARRLAPALRASTCR